MVHSGSGVDEKTIRENEIRNEMARLLGDLEEMTPALVTNITMRAEIERFTSRRIEELKQELLDLNETEEEIELVMVAVAASDVPNSTEEPEALEEGSTEALDVPNSTEEAATDPEDSRHDALFKRYENSNRCNGPFEHWRVVPGYEYDTVYAHSNADAPGMERPRNNPMRDGCTELEHYLRNHVMTGLYDYFDEAGLALRILLAPSLKEPPTTINIMTGNWLGVTEEFIDVVHTRHVYFLGANHGVEYKLHDNDRGCRWSIFVGDQTFMLLKGMRPFAFRDFDGKKQIKYVDPDFESDDDDDDDDHNFGPYTHWLYWKKEETEKDEWYRATVIRTREVYCVEISPQEGYIFDMERETSCSAYGVQTVSGWFGRSTPKCFADGTPSMRRWRCARWTTVTTWPGTGRRTTPPASSASSC